MKHDEETALAKLQEYLHAAMEDPQIAAFPHLVERIQQCAPLLLHHTMQNTAQRIAQRWNIFEESFMELIQEGQGNQMVKDCLSLLRNHPLLNEAQKEKIKAMEILYFENVSEEVQLTKDEIQRASQAFLSAFPAEKKKAMKTVSEWKKEGKGKKVWTLNDLERFLPVADLDWTKQGLARKGGQKAREKRQANPSSLQQAVAWAQEMLAKGEYPTKNAAALAASKKYSVDSSAVRRQLQGEQRKERGQ